MWDLPTGIYASLSTAKLLQPQCYDLRSRDNQMTLGHVVGTRLKRSVKAARLKQKLLFQLIRLTIKLNTKSELKALTSVPIYPSIDLDIGSDYKPI